MKCRRGIRFVVFVIAATAAVRSEAQWSGGNSTTVPINRTGNVGIGTSGAPSSILEVYGANPILKVTQSPGVGSSLLMLNQASGAGNTSGIALRGGSPYIYNDSANANVILFGADLVAANAKVFFNISSGNVGIGASAPGERLDVAGNITLNHFSNGATVNRYIGIGTTGGPVGPGTHWAGIGFSESSANDQELHLWTSASGGSASEKVTLLANGNVGIGTAAPVQRLTIVGADYQSKVGLYAFPGSGNTDVRNWGLLTSNWVYGDFAIMQSASRDADPMAGTPRLYIKNDGAIGIGTTAPTYPLTVAGTIFSSAGGFRFPDGTTQTTAANGGSTISAANVSSGIFGGNTGNGNYSFTGNLGVGTSTPGQRLTIAGDTAVLQEFKAGATSFGYLGSGSQVFYGAAATDFAIYGNGHPVKIGGRALPDLTIDITGNVGIGTMNLFKPLTVEGGYGSGINQALVLNSAHSYGVGSLTASAALVFSRNRTIDSEGLQYMGQIESGNEVETSSNESYMAFHTQSVGTLVERVRITSSGNVGIGNSNPSDLLTVGLVNGTGNKVTVNGDVKVFGTITGASVIGAVFQDLAEWVPASGDVPAGTVVILNPQKNNEVMPSSVAYDTRVAGVVSARPGLLLGVAGASKAKIATTGRVKVRVDATKHPIQIGDLLVTSGTSGAAMVSEPLDLGGVKIHRPGTLIGKALEPLANGEGEILVLLSLQ